MSEKHIQNVSDSYTASEVCEIVGTNTETLRSWRRRGYFEIKRTEGWQRYSLFDLLNIAVVADAMSGLISYEAAPLIAKIATPEMYRAAFEADDQGRLPYVLVSFEFNKPNVEVVLGIDRLLQRQSEIFMSKGGAGSMIIFDCARPLQRVLTHELVKGKS